MKEMKFEGSHGATLFLFDPQFDGPEVGAIDYEALNINGETIFYSGGKTYRLVSSVEEGFVSPGIEACLKALETGEDAKADVRPVVLEVVE